MNKKTPLEWKHLFESEEFDKEFVYDGNDLGCTLKEAETVFKIWAPTAESVVLNLYKGGDAGVDDKIEEIPMKRSDKGVWTVLVEKALKNVYYTYTVRANGEVHETQDVYSRATGVNGQRSMVVDLSGTNPTGWQEDEWKQDTSCLPVIYEVHVKDFSYDESSGIPAEYRGKYKAFTVENSTLFDRGEKPTCVAYLKELGVTHVHILPSYDYGSVDEAGADTQFNWGYDPINYNVPEGSYATDPFDGKVRIREFKEMVMALHKAGLGVIMDVVYNHTYSTDSCFQKTVPYYYYRMEENGEFSNGSICGNDTASERSMYRRYMIESVLYWAREYHIDGFRFDLMGLHDVETMNEIRARLNELPNGRNILMYGEPWFGKESAMKKGTIPAIKKNVALLSEGISIFNDDTRDAIKGSVFFEEVPGFINGKEGLEEKIASSVLAWCDGKGGYEPHDPGTTITYVSAHDNWSLWDKLNYTLKEEPDFEEMDEEILKLNKFAAGIVMTSLGMVFFQAGEEAGRTKAGIGDSYCSPPSLNALDWESMYRFDDRIEYHRGLLAIRQHCSIYGIRDRKVLEKIQFYKKEKGCVVFSIDAWKKDDRWKRLWVIYSADSRRVKVTLPKGRRVVLTDGRQVFDSAWSLSEATEILAAPKGVTVLGELWEDQA